MAQAHSERCLSTSQQTTDPEPMADKVGDEMLSFDNTELLQRNSRLLKTSDETACLGENLGSGRASTLTCSVDADSNSSFSNNAAHIVRDSRRLKVPPHSEAIWASGVEEQSPECSNLQKPSIPKQALTALLNPDNLLSEEPWVAAAYDSNEESFSFGRAGGGETDGSDDCELLIVNSFESSCQHFHEGGVLLSGGRQARKLPEMEEAEGRKRGRCALEPASASALQQLGGLSRGLRTKEDHKSVLHWELLGLCKMLELTPKEQDARAAAVLTVEEAVRDLWPRSHLLLFGSSATGLCLPQSDLDLVVTTSAFDDRAPNRSHMHVRGKQGPCPDWLQLLGTNLKRRKVASSVRPLPWAKVPILKCRLHGSGLPCDISFNVLNGPNAVPFVRRHLAVHAALRPLCLALKCFLGQRGLQEVFTGGIGSYCLLNLALALLQRLGPAGGGGDDFDLGELLVAFFHHYGGRQEPGVHDYAHDVVSVRGGRTLSKQQRGWMADDAHLLAVEDPQVPTSDIGRPSFRIRDVQCHFREAKDVLDRHWQEPGLLNRIVDVTRGRHLMGTCIGGSKQAGKRRRDQVAGMELGEDEAHGRLKKSRTKAGKWHKDGAKRASGKKKSSKKQRNQKPKGQLEMEASEQPLLQLQQQQQGMSKKEKKAWREQKEVHQADCLHRAVDSQARGDDSEPSRLHHPASRAHGDTMLPAWLQLQTLAVHVSSNSRSSRPNQTDVMVSPTKREQKKRSQGMHPVPATASRLSCGSSLPTSTAQAPQQDFGGGVPPCGPGQLLNPLPFYRRESREGGSNAWGGEKVRSCHQGFRKSRPTRKGLPLAGNKQRCSDDQPLFKGKSVLQVGRELVEGTRDYWRKSNHQ